MVKVWRWLRERREEKRLTRYLHGLERYLDGAYGYASAEDLAAYDRLAELRARHR
jgi:hypothetical protein